MVLLGAFLAMLTIVAATAALAQPEDELLCLLPEGCGPVTNGEVDYTRFDGCALAPEEELLCLLPEGCDTNGDGVPDLRAGDPAPGEGAGAVHYDNVR